jgi:hypothetical protein
MSGEFGLGLASGLRKRRDEQRVQSVQDDDRKRRIARETAADDRQHDSRADSPLPD